MLRFPQSPEATGLYGFPPKFTKRQPVELRADARVIRENLKREQERRTVRVQQNTVYFMER